MADNQVPAGRCMVTFRIIGADGEVVEEIKRERTVYVYSNTKGDRRFVNNIGKQRPFRVPIDDENVCVLPVGGSRKSKITLPPEPWA